MCSTACFFFKKNMVGIFFVQNRFLLFYTSSQLNTQMASSSIQAKKRETIFYAVRQFSWMKNWFNNVIVRIRAKNFFLFSVPKNKLKLLLDSIIVWCYFYLIGSIWTTYPHAYCIYIQVLCTDGETIKIDFPVKF